MPRQPTCLHSSNFDIALQHWFQNASKKAASRAAFEHSGLEQRLFRGLLARRIERPGTVDVGDLVIAETKHLPQDFIGVLA